MSRSLILPGLCCLALAACKPTPRTAPDAHRPTPAAPVPAENSPAEPVAAPSAEAARGLVLVRTAQQDYNQLIPWLKQEMRYKSSLGIYLGRGLVLSTAEPLCAATYAELALPDDTLSVPARVLRCDRDLNLALLSVAQESDAAALFRDMPELAIGNPLKLGDTADVVGKANGLHPFARRGEVCGVSGSVPQLMLQVARLPEGTGPGTPVIREGKLAGLAVSGNGEQLNIVNAELIARFLREEQTGTPLLGVQLRAVQDPVLHRYLGLEEGSGGLYISRVFPGGAAAASGLQEGDVITAVEGMPIDASGRCEHPLYGRCAAGSLLSILKPLGEELTLSILRRGEQQELRVPLNRDVLRSGLRARTEPGSRPRYMIRGGLVFQPLNATYIDALEESQGKENTALPYLRAQQQETELLDQGVREPIALTLVIPTPATAGYEQAGAALVTAVNGSPVHHLGELAELLDRETEDNIIRISINKAPYELYLDRSTADASDEQLRHRGIPALRVLSSETAD